MESVMKSIFLKGTSLLLTLAIAVQCLAPLNVQAETTENTVTFSQEELKEKGYRIPEEDANIEKNDMSIRRWSSQSAISNDYVEVAVNRDDGKFTIGNNEGDPNYSSDDDEILLYGHPYPGTSETLIKVGSNEFYFEADTIEVINNKVYAYMNSSDFNIQIVQILEFVNNEKGMPSVVKISYKINNTGSSTKDVGIRIMMDTMLAHNDHAPFKISGYGNVTTRKSFTGASIPQTYQVYDDLDNPTTIATGILYNSGERRPDKVFFTNWGNAVGSYWGYDHGEGYELGDSAVVIYYDPVSLTRGTSYTVSTYYGPGAGNNVQTGSTIVVAKNEIGIRVKDKQTSEYLKDVEVTVTNKSSGISETQSTGSNGVAIFTKEISGACTITATKESYSVLTEDRVLNYKNFYDLALKPEGDTSPDITSMTLDGVDVRTQKVTYCENKDEVEVTPSNSKVAKLKVEGTVPGSVYQLYQDGTVIMNSTSGEFNLTEIVKNAKGVAYDIPRIKELSAGKAVYVLAIGPDGSKSEKVRVNIEVKEPSSGKIVQKGSFSLGSKVSVKLNPDEMNPVEKFFLGDSSFDLGTDVFPLSVEYEEDGKIKIMINSTEEADDFKEDFERAKKRYDWLKHFNSKSLKVAQPFEFDFHVAGYGEGYLADGEAIINVDILCYLKGSASWTTYFFVVSCPCYVKTTVEGKLQVEVAANVHNQNGWNFEFTKGDIEPSVTGRIELGAGLSGVLSAGIEGSGDIKYLYSLPSDYYKLSTTLAATIKAKAFLLEYNRTIAKYTFVWADGYADGARGISTPASAAMFAMDEVYEPENYVALSRDYLNLNSPVVYSRDDSLITVKSNTFTNAMPQMIECGGNYYIFWLEDSNSVDSVEDRLDVNRTVLVYSKYNLEQDEWSEVQAVDNDGTADFNFDLTTDGENIYVVWQDMGTVFEENADITLEGYSEAADVSAAKVNATDGTISKYTVPSSEESDVYPQISVMDEEVMIAWYSTVAENVFGTEGGYTIHSAVLNGETFVENTTHEVGEGIISDFEFGYIEEQPIIIYGVDSNDELINSSDRELYIIKDGVVERFTENSVTDSAPQLVKEGNSSVLYWYQDGAIAYTSDLKNVSTITSGNDFKIPESFSVLTNEDGTVKRVVWTSFGTNYEEDGCKSVYAIDYNENQWSSAYEMTTLDCGELSKISGVIEEDGKERMVLHRTQYFENVEGSEEDEDYEYVQDNVSQIWASDIFLLRSQERRTISVDSIDYDRLDAVTGMQVPIEVKVSNSGNVVANDINVCIGDFYEEKYEINLLPGETTTVEITDFVVPEDYEEDTLWISVESADEAYDNITYDETVTQEIILNYTDLKVKDAGKVIIGDTEYVVVEVSNLGKMNANDINVKLIADETEGEVLLDEHIDTLEGEETVNIYYPLNTETEMDVLYARLTSSAREYYEDNNVELITCTKALGQIEKSVNVAIESADESKGTVISAVEGVDLEGNIEECFTSGQEITITAVPKEGYVFAGWSEEGVEGLLGTISDVNQKTVTYIVPNDDSRIVAHFAVQNVVTDFTDSNTNVEMVVEERLKLSPSITTVDGLASTDYIVWESSNEDVVLVEEGELFAKSAGTAIVTATLVSRTADEDVYTSKQIEYAIEVKNPTITDIVFTENEIDVHGIGVQSDLKSFVFIEPINVATNLVWSSSDETVATVTQEGIITTTGVGTAVISVYTQDDEAISAECTVTVDNPVTGVVIDGESTVLLKGTEITLNATVYPIDYTGEVTIDWRTQNPDVVNVKEINGSEVVIEAVGSGNAYIAVTANEFESHYWITVVNPIEQISLNDSEITLDKFEGMYLSYNLTPYDAEGEVFWSSSDENVATVDSYGYVYGVGPGTAIITATTDNGKTAACTVNVNPYGYVMYIPDGTTIVNANTWSDLKSTHPYEENSSIVWEYYSPQATSIELHFNTESELEYSYDRIYVLDKDNRLVYEFTGSQMANQWITIEGNAAKIYLDTDGSVNRYGFEIDDAEETKKAPGTPKSVKVSKKSYTSINVSWNASSGAEGYRVYRREGTTGEYKLVGKCDKDTLKFTDKELSTGTTYYYKVKAYCNSKGTKVYSSYSSAEKLKLVLDTPDVTTSNSSSSGKPKLTWSKVKGASKYQVYRATSSSGTYKSLGTTTSTKYTDKSATAGKKYYYKVKAICKATSSGNSAKSIAKKITCDCARPEVKISTISSSGKPKLTWSKVTGASKYQVYRATSSSGTYKSLGKTTSTSYTDKSAKAGKKYYYKVKAICKATSSGNSAKSEANKIVCDCARPTVKIKTSSGKPKLTWSKVTGASKYQVYRATSSSGKYKSLGTTTSTKYTDKSAKAGKKYYYKVKAICKATTSGNSAKSTAKSIKAKK